MKRVAHLNTWCSSCLDRAARFSLPSAFVLVASCLVTEVPEFIEPQRSAPYAITASARAMPSNGEGVPATNIVQVDEETSEILFTTDVQSEDAGRSLLARVFINYDLEPKPGGGRTYLEFGGGDALPPSVFGEIRTISATFSRMNRLENNRCYQATLVVTHAWDNREGIPVDPADTTVVVWWVVKGNPSAVAVSSCPGLSSSPLQDGGL